MSSQHRTSFCSDAVLQLLPRRGCSGSRLGQGGPAGAPSGARAGCAGLGSGAARCGVPDAPTWSPVLERGALAVGKARRGQITEDGKQKYRKDQ